MAQYYVPTHSTHPNATSGLETSAQSDTESVYHDMEQSAFIFPNPTRSPTSSPYATSSALSVPSDFDFTISSPGQSRSREGRTGTHRRVSQSTGASGSSWHQAAPGRSSSVDTGFGSSDIEVWNWTGDEDEEGEGEGLSVGAGRTDRWDILQTPGNARQLQQYRFQPRYPLRQAPTNVLTYADGRRRALVRRRHASESPSRSEYAVDAMDVNVSLRARKISFKDPSSLARQDLLPSSTRTAPYPLPFLSLFASLFSIDDDTLALLSNPTNPQTSILFRGAPMLVGLAFDEDDLIVAEKKRRVLMQLGELSSSKLKEGVAVACDSEITPTDRFAVTISLASIWALVGEVCQVPHKLWSDAWYHRRQSAKN